MPTWIFDLDNTLHDAEPYIFPEMNRLMTAYVAQHLGISAAEADVLRLQYWQRYGTTLAGLQRHGHIDPEHFLNATHQFPDLARELRPMQALHATLQRLPGRKILFTNAPEAYAITVLRGLRVAHLFDGLVAIQHTGLQPKPRFSGYRGLLHRYRLNPRDCIMVEDTAVNLVTAKRLGMRTVWLAPHARRNDRVDIGLTRLLDLPRQARQLGWLR
ncbi:HAD family hydrolase [Chitinimonas naiadis]